MPKFYVSITIPSSVKYTVEAANADDAEHKAMEQYDNEEGDLNMETHFDSAEVTHVEEDTSRPRFVTDEYAERLEDKL